MASLETEGRGVTSRSKGAGTGPGLAEVLWVWLVLAVFALVVFTTYSRSFPEPLYNTSHHGVANGASRVLVFLGFPGAFGVIAVVGVVYAVGREASLPRFRLGGLALLGVALCPTAGVPGVVEQSHLDAKPVNVLAAFGVALSLMLTLWATKARGIGRPAPCGSLRCDGPTSLLSSAHYDAIVRTRLALSLPNPETVCETLYCGGLLPNGVRDDSGASGPPSSTRGNRSSRCSSAGDCRGGDACRDP